MHKLLQNLSEKRPVFHSEADFQHALAWEIQIANKSSAVRLEKQLAMSGDRVHLDLLVKDKDKHIAIELKYKTKKASCEWLGESFELRNQSAQDIGRYDCLKDILRIERYVQNNPGSEGYVVLLSNDKTYWQRSMKENAVDTAFRVHEGRVINGELAWGADASKGTMKGRESAICISGSYEISWRNFSNIQGQEFRYVLVHIPPV